MDEILDKLHREGRAALTDEEHRFLVRVSARYRNRRRRSERDSPMASAARVAVATCSGAASDTARRGD